MCHGTRAWGDTLCEMFARQPESHQAPHVFNAIGGLGSRRDVGVCSPFRHRTKTGNPVYLLLRPEIAEELRNIPPGPDAHPDYFFWSGRGKKNKAASTWQKALRKLWKLVTPPLVLKDRDGKRLAPKSHMLRNTFAVELLKKKVSLDHVAVLLGDNPETVREHYFKWVPELQQVLDDEVKRTWKTEPVILEDADHAISAGVN